jgi:UDP-N-acetylmuramyl tripeptide synthase
LVERLGPGFVRRRGRRLSATTTVVSGTNGKTTTAAMLASILQAAGRNVLTNPSGANLYRGVASALASSHHVEDVAVFEVDEGALPRVSADVEPAVLVLTNVFRDQLDRFGEPENVARLLADTAHALPAGSSIVANADDPLLWHAVEDLDPIGFGVRFGRGTDILPRLEGDPEICPRCGGPTRYRRRTVAHLGAVACLRCRWGSPDPVRLTEIVDDAQLDRLQLLIDGFACELHVGGAHNAYNATAAIAAASVLGIPTPIAVDALRDFAPRFGRSERLAFEGRTLWVLLAKNPASCVTAARQIMSDPRTRAVAIMVNDEVADGRDVSWIWDAGLETFQTLGIPIVAGGSRAHDVALRFRYAGCSVDAVQTRVGGMLETLAALTEPGDDVALLATYTAMLDLRRAVLGSRRERVSNAGSIGTGPRLERTNR